MRRIFHEPLLGSALLGFLSFLVMRQWQVPGTVRECSVEGEQATDWMWRHSSTPNRLSSSHVVLKVCHGKVPPVSIQLKGCRLQLVWVGKPPFQVHEASSSSQAGKKLAVIHKVRVFAANVQACTFLPRRVTITGTRQHPSQFQPRFFNQHGRLICKHQSKPVHHSANSLIIHICLMEKLTTLRNIYPNT